MWNMLDEEIKAKYILLIICIGVFFYIVDSYINFMFKCFVFSQYLKTLVTAMKGKYDTVIQKNFSYTNKVLSKIIFLQMILFRCKLVHILFFKLCYLI